MIFYFSGTGNTRWLAHTLAEALHEPIYSIADMLRHGDNGSRLQMAPDERIGFCFPVHGWRPPFIVRQFVRNLRLQVDGAVHYTYAFATCGDDVGQTFDYLRTDLRQAGLLLDSVFSIIMPESYIFPLVDTLDKPDVAEQKKRDAYDEFNRILPMIEQRKVGVKDFNRSRWPWINSHLLGSFFLGHWVTDRPFRVDAERCNRCGKCAKVCPVGNIACEPGQTPHWQHNGMCTTCFACYHHCPAHAIDFGHRTKGKRQYFFEKGN